MNKTFSSFIAVVTLKYLSVYNVQSVNMRISQLLSGIFAPITSLSKYVVRN